MGETRPSPSWQYDVPPLLWLPRELQKEIFTYLDERDLRTMHLVCPVLAEVASDRLLFRQLHLVPEDLAGKTLHQVLVGYSNVRKLVCRGVRFTKSTCLRIAKDLPKLTRLCLHLSKVTAANNENQELSNVTTYLPSLSSIDISFVERAFTNESLLDSLKKLRRIERFCLLQSNHGAIDRSAEPRQVVDHSDARRMDMNAILTQLAFLHNAAWVDVKIDYRSYRDVRRAKLDGIKPMIQCHWRTLTSLHLRHVEFSLRRGSHMRQTELFSYFYRLRFLKHLGLTGVEGFGAENWIDFFVGKRERTSSQPLDRNKNRSPRKAVEPSLTFPRLESLELDFVPDVVIGQLGRLYGDRLKTLVLCEYARIFENDDDDVAAKSPGEFSEILHSFEALTKLTLGFKFNSIDDRMRRIVRWFSDGDLGSSHYPIEIVKL